MRHAISLGTWRGTCDALQLCGHMEPLVLFVDDDPDMGDLVQAALARRGIGVVCCASLAEARRALEYRRVEVVITDVTLTDGGDGFDLCRFVNEHYPGVPVVVLTGDREAGGTATEAGAAAFLTKPVGMAQLVQVLRQVLGDRDLAQLHR